jgi:hypothetical protein
MVSLYSGNIMKCFHVSHGHLALSYFYGVAPGVPPAEYEDTIHGQLVAAGATQEAAEAEVKWLDELLRQLRRAEVLSAAI